MVKLLYLWTAAMLASAAPVTAQKVDQAKIDAMFAVWTEGEGLKMVDHLAKCTVEKYPDAAEGFALDVSDPYRFQNDLENLMDPKCFKSYFFRSSRTSVTPSVYQPLIAEALLLQTYAGKVLPDVGAIEGPNDRPRLPDVPIKEVHPYHRDNFILDRYATKLGEISECIARREPANVMLLAGTEKGSDEEKTALATIDQNAAGCGLTNLAVTFPTFVRRGELMRELYRLTKRADTAATEDRPDA